MVCNADLMTLARYRSVSRCTVSAAVAQSPFSSHSPRQRVTGTVRLIEGFVGGNRKRGNLIMTELEVVTPNLRGSCVAVQHQIHGLFKISKRAGSPADVAPLRWHLTPEDRPTLKPASE
jgi:hypothetical protein